MFYSGLSSLVHVLVVGGLTYLWLILVLRVSGKRTLSKLNAFDLVVTVALGSTLAAAILDRNVSLADSAAAFALLVLLQFVVSTLSLRFKMFERLVKSEPKVLFREGEYLEGPMAAERVAKEEIQAAIRSAGLAELGLARAVVLETDGSLSVIKDGDPVTGSAMPT